MENKTRPGIERFYEKYPHWPDSNETEEPLGVGATFYIPKLHGGKNGREETQSHSGG